MNRKEILKNKLNISAILFNNNVPVDEAKIIGTFIEDLEQQVKKQEEAIDKVLKIIWKNYFVLDKCEIEMLEDTLKEALK